MRNKCTRCDKELYLIYNHGLCWDCKERQSMLEFVAVVSVAVMILFAIIGIRVVWAHYVLDDWRYAFNECRIIKE